jgi:SAM-dependent methyltransferase
VKALNDLELVRRDYADESRLSARIAAQQSSTGPDPRQAALDAVAECRPRRVLEVGPGRGELAERIQTELGAHVVGVDQSERMVELTRRRGVEAIVGDVQALPFEDGGFDCALAAWMLYHVPDLDLGLRELRRVLHAAGRLVAVTNSSQTLPELWDLLADAGSRTDGFSAENGEAALRRHFETVERRDVHGAVIFADRDAAHRYVSSSPKWAHLADSLPAFDGPLVASRHVAVFICES